MNIASYILLAIVIILALTVMRHLHRGGGTKSCCKDCSASGTCNGCCGGR